MEDLEWSVRTDGDGYWELAMNRPLALTPGWHEITSEPAASSAAGLLVVDPENRVGIISDVDDTVLVSGVVEKRTLLKNSLTVPPERREAVPGMAALYHGLLRRNPRPEASAVFYVSASPKQLTDNLRGFLAGQGFPRGVLRLKEFSEASGASILDRTSGGINCVCWRRCCWRIQRCASRFLEMTESRTRRSMRRCRRNSRSRSKRCGFAAWIRTRRGRDSKGRGIRRCCWCGEFKTSSSGRKPGHYRRDAAVIDSIHPPR